MIDSGEMPFACNLAALESAERTELHRFAQLLSEATLSTRETTGGYELTLDANRFSGADAARWLSLERRCCPFLDFQPGSEAAGMYIVAISGTEGAKPFILAEFPTVAYHLRKG